MAVKMWKREGKRGRKEGTEGERKTELLGYTGARLYKIDSLSVT